MDLTSENQPSTLNMENGEQGPPYWLWGKDQVAYSIDMARLAQWFKEGRVTSDQWIFSIKTSHWQKVADLAELHAFLRSAPQPSLTGTTLTRRNIRSLALKPETLRRLKGFEGMNDPQIESFIRYMEVLPCQQFSHIVRKGEHGDAMYLVLEGELRALAMVDGKESTLGTIPAGEAFGEISLMDHGPRSADVVANRDSILLKISAADFNQLLREAPALAVPFLMALSRSIVGRVRLLTKRYEDSIRFLRAAQLPR